MRFAPPIRAAAMLAAAMLAAVILAAANGRAQDFDRRIIVPVKGAKIADLRDTFNEGRAGRRHEATDIIAPRGTPVLAADDGAIAKLFLSKPGGITIYEFDPTERFCYYYAHLDHYASGLAEKMTVQRGDVIGYVGV